MLIKIGSVIVILTVSYVLAVFIAPKQADEVGKVLGISDFNQVIRNSKHLLDSATDTVNKLQDQSGGIVNTAEKNLKQVQSGLNEVKTTVEETKNTIETKVNQAKQIADTAQSLKTQIDTFTTLSGSTQTGSTGAQASASGSVTTSTSPTSR